MDTPKPFPPLVTGRSPSYERARAERAHPSPTTDPAVIAALARLFELEEEARQAYALAAEASASDPALAKQLQASADGHGEKRAALGQRIEELGGAPPRLEECRRLLGHGADAVARSAGSAALRDELRALEDELRTAHAQTPSAPPA
jgi:hypothetical protein